MINFFSKRKNQKLQQRSLEKVVEAQVQKNHDKVNKTINKTIKITDNLNKVIDRNGFTIQIHAATRGKQHHAN